LKVRGGGWGVYNTTTLSNTIHLKD
jgi:hypothetical protein